MSASAADGQPFVMPCGLRPRRRPAAAARLDRQPAVPRARGRRAGLRHGHAARRPASSPPRCSSPRCTTAASSCSAPARRFEGAEKRRGARRARRRPAARPAHRRPAAEHARARGHDRSSRCRWTSGRSRSATAPPEVVDGRRRLDTLDRRRPAAAARRAHRSPSAGGDAAGVRPGVASMTRRRPPSLWLETCGDDLTPRPALPGDITADVAIVGAGFTGLWTAHHLLRHDPTLRVVVLEREIAGWGASGPQRRLVLGAVPGAVAADRRRVRRRRRAADASRRCNTPSTTSGAWCDEHDVDARLREGRHAVAGPRRRTARAAAARRPGRGCRPRRRAQRIAATGIDGARYTPHCAALHPARLVRGLARVVEAQGATIYERTAATAISPGRVVTPAGIGPSRASSSGPPRDTPPTCPSTHRTARAGLVADHRDRAAAAPRSGNRSAGGTARRSTTNGT